MSEFKRWLRSQGCSFQESKRHTTGRVGDRKSMLPRHPSKEIKQGTKMAILRDLGLKE